MEAKAGPSMRIIAVDNYSGPMSHMVSIAEVVPVNRGVFLITTCRCFKYLQMGCNQLKGTCAA